MMLRFVIPTPPSVWELYVGWGKNRRLAPSYKKWREDAGWMVRRHEKPLTCRVVINVAVKRQSKLADIDNRSKAVCDLLQHYQIIKNDNLVEKITCQWHDGKEECVVLVQPYEQGMAA